MTLDPCAYCGASLHHENDKRRLYDCMSRKVVCCADSDTCNARRKETNFCDYCDTEFPVRELCPRRITGDLTPIHEGLMCKDRDACQSRRDERKAQESDDLEQSRISDPNPSYYASW